MYGYTSHHIPFFSPTTNSLLKGLFVQRTLDPFSRGFLVSSGWWCSSCLLLLLVVVVVHLSFFSFFPIYMVFSSVCSFCSVGRYITLSTNQREEEKQQKSPSIERKKTVRSHDGNHTRIRPTSTLLTFIHAIYLLISPFLSDTDVHSKLYDTHRTVQKHTHKHKIGRLSVNLTSRFYIANNVVCYYWVDGQKRKLWSKQLLSGKEPYNSFLPWLSLATTRMYRIYRYLVCMDSFMYQCAGWVIIPHSSLFLLLH